MPHPVARQSLTQRHLFVRANSCIYSNVFTWDVQKAIANFQKHGVSFEEAATIFGDSKGLDGDDAGYSTLEHRRQRIGQSMTGRVLFVVYTLRRKGDEKETIRIISARQASRKERAAYGRFEN